MPELSDLELDPSDKVLLASVLFMGGGLVVLASPALAAAATVTAGFAAFTAGGSLAIGITGLGVWGTSFTTSNEEQNLDMFRAYAKTAKVASQIHDPIETAVEWGREKVNNPTIDVFDDADAKLVLETLRGTADELEVRSWVGDKLSDAGEDLLEDIDKPAKKAEPSTRPDVMRESLDPWSDNQCRIIQNETRSIEVKSTEPAKSAPNDHPMCTEDSGVPVHQEFDFDRGSSSGGEKGNSGREGSEGRGAGGRGEGRSGR